MKENQRKILVLSTNICSFPQSGKVIHNFIHLCFCIFSLFVHKKSPLPRVGKGGIVVFL